MKNIPAADYGGPADFSSKICMFSWQILRVKARIWAITSLLKALLLEASWLCWLPCREEICPCWFRIYDGICIELDGCWWVVPLVLLIAIFLVQSSGTPHDHAENTKDDILHVSIAESPITMMLLSRIPRSGSVQSTTESTSRSSSYPPRNFQIPVAIWHRRTL